MIYAIASLALAMPAPAAPTSDWAVKQLQFSAVSIGVAFANHTTGWSSFTNGAGPIKITKTSDGGNTWTPVANQSSAIMVMDVANMNANAKEPNAVFTTGMLATEYSTDGNKFSSAAHAPFISQSIKAYQDGKVVLASGNGVCTSDGGKSYTCNSIPASVLKTDARYVGGVPSQGVLYVTAGQWPSHMNATANAVELTSNLRLARRSFALGEAGGSRLSLEQIDRSTRGAPPAPPAGSGYAAQILKSVDYGKTWTSLFYDTGNFYFNDIDCFGPNDCVAVGEGFGQDGSKAPGARVYITTDGETFQLAHHEAVDGSSLMAAKKLTGDKIVVGGRLQDGLSLHSTDGGKTFAKKGANVTGQAITAMSFVTETHGFATAVNGLQ